MKRTGLKSVPRDVDEYLAGVRKEARVVLEKLRQTIKESAIRCPCTNTTAW